MACGWEQPYPRRVRPLTNISSQGGLADIGNERQLAVTTDLYLCGNSNHDNNPQDFSKNLKTAYQKRCRPAYDRAFGQKDPRRGAGAIDPNPELAEALNGMTTAPAAPLFERIKRTAALVQHHADPLHAICPRKQRLDGQ